MVKKIRILPEAGAESDTPELDNVEFNKEVLELAKTMDWKLWEILQTVQRLEARMADIEKD